MICFADEHISVLSFGDVRLALLLFFSSLKSRCNMARKRSYYQMSEHSGLAEMNTYPQYYPSQFMKPAINVPKCYQYNNEKNNIYTSKRQKVSHINTKKELYKEQTIKCINEPLMCQMIAKNNAILHSCSLNNKEWNNYRLNLLSPQQISVKLSNKTSNLPILSILNELSPK